MSVASRKMQKHYSAPTSGGGDRFYGDPGVGNIYYGQSVEGGDPAARESYYGKRVGLFRSYFQASDISGMVSRATSDKSVGRFSVISTKLPSSWADVAAGNQDSWCASITSQLGSLNHAMALCLHHEPENDQNGSDMTGATFKAMYHHFKTFTDQYPSISLMPIYMGSWHNTVINPGGFVAMSTWLDENMCDLVGMDGYNQWYSGGNRWRPVTDVFSPTLAQMTSVSSKPIMWVEYGCREDTTGTNDANAWLEDARNLLLGYNNGQVAGTSYFDSGQNSPNGTWALDVPTNTRLNKFKSLLLSSDGHNKFLAPGS